MDSGLGTSERVHRRATVAAPTAPMQMNPSILCRNCRIYLSLDDMEAHECDLKDLKAASSSSPRADALLKAASRASSFLDSFLDSDTPTQLKPAVATTSQKTSESYGSASPTRLAPKEFTAPVHTVEPANLVQVQPQPSRPPLPAPVAISPAVVVDKPEPIPQPHRYESLSHSSSAQSPTGMNPTKLEAAPSSPPTLANLGRSLSAMSPSPAPHDAPETTSTSPLAMAQRPRGQSSAGSSAVPVQCRVRGVRLNKDKVAVYSIVSNLFDQQGEGHATADPTSAIAKPNEVIVERRYREFHAFALAVYSIFPSQDLWQRLPPKTMCLPSSNHMSGGFLLRRKNGLDDFIRRALELMELGSDVQGTIGQWYLIRKFLNLPSVVSNVSNQQQPTRDRSLVTAMHELKKHARQKSGWTVVGRADEHDTMYEKVSDGFQVVKRIKSCAFPARAIFDMITKRTGRAAGRSSVEMPDDPSTENASGATPSAASAPTGATWDPNVDVVEVLRRDNRKTWTERIVYKGRWTKPNLEMISLKSWKVDETGSIVVVMIPAEDSDWAEAESKRSRVDCVLGGWIITPVLGEETCSVMWLMQVNFGECDPRNEFTGSQSFTTSFIARSFLLTWADEIVHLLGALEAVYDPVYYRNLGPLLSGGDFHKLRLERRDTISSGNAMGDPRVYVLAHELEPSACLLVHKSSNTNALIFMTHHACQSPEKQQQLDLDMQAPLKAEWIMFEKPGNPRQELSTIERNSTYSFSTRHIGPNVFQFRLELLKRDCVLRRDPTHGFALFTTINGKPNVLLKRVYLIYTAPTTRLSFTSKLQEIHLFGESEVEIMSMVPSATTK